VKEERTLPPPIFLGGAVALDFLNSIATPVDEIVEWMGNGVDFLSWMRQAGLLTDEDVRTIDQRMSAARLDAVARDARALRDWFRGFVNEHRGSHLKKSALEEVGPLNRLLGSDAVFWQLEPSETLRERVKNKGASSTIFQLRPRRYWRKPDSLLSPLAEEIAKFICSADFRRIKACEGGNCTLLFLDQSHRHGRRWCSMAICGNRAKSAAFAARVKGAKGKG
jgi:CGNR zinc finger/Putative stress-induced transcription regulator